jgi:hypothetical protein
MILMANSLNSRISFNIQILHKEIDSTTERIIYIRIICNNNINFTFNPVLLE